MDAAPIRSAFAGIDLHYSHRSHRKTSPPSSQILLPATHPRILPDHSHAYTPGSAHVPDMPSNPPTPTDQNPELDNAYGHSAYLLTS